MSNIPPVALPPGPAPSGQGVTTEAQACPFARLRQTLRHAGLRPTRQRMQLGMLLFSPGDRHTSAEDLFRQSREMRADLSLATVYNTLNQFCDAGLLRKVASCGDRTMYDTNTGNHHHFLVEEDGAVFDVEAGDIEVSMLPAPPPGFRIVGVDVVVRLERITEQQA